MQVAPRLGDDLRAYVRADLSLVKLNDAIERGGFDVTFLDQDRFERAHPQLHLGKIGTVLMIVIVRSHRLYIAQ
jgi:hypothetical protein